MRGSDSGDNGFPAYSALFTLRVQLFHQSATVLTLAGLLVGFGLSMLWAAPVGGAQRMNTVETTAVLVGAGDIASCASTGDEATAKLLDGISGTVFTTGDNVYSSGTSTEFNDCYSPSWGRHRARTRPSAGNHEYRTPNASGYYQYFGASAGDPRRGYYSYNQGSWHIVVLNSNCASVGGCGVGSPQERWLRADLASHSTSCTLAYWHSPRFSSGPHGSDTAMQPFWKALHDYGVEVAITGHDHHYERFAPQDARGALDPAYGIREFVVGTGGKSHYAIGTPLPNSEVHNDNTFGVLKLTLRSGGYDWRFVPEASRTFSDSGSQACHSPRYAPAPVAKGPTQHPLPGSTLGTTSVPVRLRWSATDATGTIKQYWLQESVNGSAYRGVALPTPTTTTINRSLAVGTSYRYRVKALDNDGNPSMWAYGPRFTVARYQETHGSTTYGGYWRSATLSGASGGSVRYATRKDAYARFSFTGRGVAWVAPKSTSRGKALIYLDGVYVGKVNLYSAQTESRKLVFARSWSGSSAHTLTVRPVGTAGHPRIDVDAFVVLR